MIINTYDTTVLLNYRSSLALCITIPRFETDLRHASMFFIVPGQVF